MYARNALLQRAVSDIDLRAADVVVGFDTCSWILGERARRLDRPFVLDQSIAHPRSKNTIYGVLRQRFPQWAVDVQDKLAHHLDLERAEHELADRVVVASDFTARTLIDNGVPARRIVRIPYGVDLGRFQPLERSEPGRPFRFAFMGLVNARKGVPVLLEAWARGRPEGSELWIIGSAPGRARRLLAGVPGLAVLGHRPHAELPALLAECDALVFPSFFEGFGMVLLEALAMGLPVIATDATAAPDLDDGSGAIQIIPTGDVDALIAAMAAAKSEWAGGSKRDAARAIAERYSWRRYGDAWLRLLEEVVAESSIAPHSRPLA
jgi:glycosyltransferase involved in cell wall biosynthesis